MFLMMTKGFRLLCTIFSLGWVFFTFLAPIGVMAKQNEAIFSTWESFEVDKCASIWLIKRFVNTDARIKFFPKGTLINEGVLFDIPDAKLRRYHNMSTFESILKNYKLNDYKLQHIGKLIHDIEVNTWEKKRFKETLHINRDILLIIEQSKNPKEIIEKTCKYLDEFYKRIKSKY